ncbi:MAG: hypothetical protein WCG91_03135 [Candidatus Shapirobacteria bacterium]
MAHKKELIDGESPQKTGVDASLLRYDSLGKFLDGMSDGLEFQAIKDKVKDRPKLSELGVRAAEKIREAAEIVDEMWRISEPHMEDGDK